MSLFRDKIYDADLAKKVEEARESNKEPGTAQVLAEMYQVIQHCSYPVKKKIPDKFVDFLRKNMDENWKGDLDFMLKLNDMNLLPGTRVLISLVYRDFLCTESERKEMIEEKRQEANASGYRYEERTLMDLIDLMS